MARGEVGGGLAGLSKPLSAESSLDSYLSNFDNRRSFRTRPPVCSFGQ